MRFDLIGEMMDIDDGRLDARCGAVVQRVIDQAPAGDLNQWLGRLQRQRPHARAQPRRKHHGDAWDAVCGWDFRHR